MFFLINYTTDPIIKFIGENFAELNITSITTRLLLSIFCGGIIGVERATKRHAAGFRTYILVCLGATIAMLTNQFIFEFYGSGDVGRLGAQVISGIGFLGAGTILVTSRNQIKGLTTAAGLWASACTGLSIGVGFYTLGILSSVIIIISLTILPPIENFFTRRSHSHEFHIELQDVIFLKDLIAYIRSQELAIRSLSANAAYAGSGLSVYTVTINMPKKSKFHGKDYKLIMSVLNELSYINYIEKLY